MMDKHIEVIGIDHGWSNMKTVSSIFEWSRKRTPKMKKL